jgi:pimeloyl-ACP methyl ester carboxylesterase
VIGHGLGGNVAIELLRRRPEAIRRLALISTDPLPESHQQVAAEEALVVAAKTGRLAECMAQLVPKTALFDAPWRSEILALVQDMASTLGLDQFMRQLRAMQRRPDQQKTLRRADVPTLILTGAKDTIVPPRRAEFLAGLMPQGCLEIIPDAGYLPQLEQPDAVTNVLETFLSGRLPTLLLR